MEHSRLSWPLNWKELRSVREQFILVAQVVRLGLLSDGNPVCFVELAVVSPA